MKFVIPACLAARTGVYFSYTTRELVWGVDQS